MGIIHERMEWLLVRPVNLPTAETHLDDHIRIDVTSLPGSDHGPMIDTVRLWQLGVRAGAPWRAWIRLAYLWDTAKQRNGGKRVYATRPAIKRGPKGMILDLYGKPVMDRGKPVTDWSDARAVHTGKEEQNPRADRVPMLDTATWPTLALTTAKLKHLRCETGPRKPDDGCGKWNGWEPSSWSGSGITCECWNRARRMKRQDYLSTLLPALMVLTPGALGMNL